MIVFFIIITILFFLALIFLVFCLSTVEIEVNNLLIDSENEKCNKIQNDLFYIRLKLLNKITWFKIKIDKNKRKEIQNSKILKSKIFNSINKYDNIINFILKNNREIFKKDNLQYIKQINVELKKLNLDMKLCTLDAITTSFGVAILASIISIILANNKSKYKNNKYNYIITPKYEQKPSVKLKLDCIISIKIVHIMNVIYMFIKKRSVEYDERTSNRRTYASLNE